MKQEATAAGRKVLQSAEAQTAADQQARQSAGAQAAAGPKRPQPAGVQAAAGPRRPQPAGVQAADQHLLQLAEAATASLHVKLHVLPQVLLPGKLQLLLQGQLQGLKLRAAQTKAAAARESHQDQLPRRALKQKNPAAGKETK